MAKCANGTSSGIMPRRRIGGGGVRSWIDACHSLRRTVFGISHRNISLRALGGSAARQQVPKRGAEGVGVGLLEHFLRATHRGREVSILKHVAYPAREVAVSCMMRERGTRRVPECGAELSQAPARARARDAHRERRRQGPRGRVRARWATVQSHARAHRCVRVVRGDAGVRGGRAAFDSSPAPRSSVRCCEVSRSSR